MFRMALIDWVSDFLFATDGPTDAAILLSPLQGTHAQLMSTQAWQRGGTGAVASHWLLLPAFSVAGVSVGLVVERAAGRAPRLTRYVRCDDAGATLCVGEDADGGLEAEFVRFDSPRAATRAYCQFAPSLREHLRARKGAPSADDAAVARALRHCVVLREARASCAACGSRGRCACAFRFTRARHPLDFAHTARNTIPLLGHFRGVGRSTTFADGRAVTMDSISTELRTRAGGEAGATERMLFWAVQACLGTAKPNPLMLEMPSSPADDGAVMAELFLRADVADDEMRAPCAAALEGAMPGVKVEDACVMATAAPMEEAVLAAEAVQERDAVVPVVGQDEAEESRVHAEIRANGVHSSAGRATSFGCGLAPMVSQIGMWDAARPIAHTHANIGWPTGGTQHAGLPAKRSWIAIAPAPGVAVPSGAAPPAASRTAARNDGLDGYSSTERRKILKREAAARSNAKRREVVALQRQLSKIRAKEEALRRRALDLRAENKKLRANLGI